MAQPKHEQVRRRYRFRCGYCGVSETDTGGELTVDHFYPVFGGGDGSDDNLVYACWRCNSYKLDTLPNSPQRKQDERLLHPLLDRIADHVFVNDFTGFLEPKTETGRFHINKLNLNRPGLIAHRRQRWQAELTSEVLHGLAAELRFTQNGTGSVTAACQRDKTGGR